MPHSKDTILVKFKLNANIKAIENSSKSKVEKTIPRIDVKVMKVPLNKTAEEMVEHFNKLPSVEYAELNGITESLQNTSIPDDTDYGDQFHLPGIRCPEAWYISKENSGIVVAVLDSGIDVNHEDLADNIHVSSWNIVDDNDNVHTTHNHGTAVAGIVGAVTDNYTGIAGVAWNCGLMVIRVLTDGRGTLADIVNGTIYAVDNGAHVINMSFGGSSYSQTLEQACQYAYNNGVAICAAAGNAKHDGVIYPAKFDTVIAVGGVTDEYSHDSTSRGYDLSVSAYASGVITTASNDNYFGVQGTSYASPQVAGVVVLLLSQNAYLTPFEIKRAIEAGANKDIYGGDYDPYDHGHGKLDAYASLMLVVNDEIPLWVNVLVATDIEYDSATLRCRIDGLMGWLSADVYFQYREVGEADWISTTPQTITEAGILSVGITGLDAGTEYEYRPVIEWDGGVESAEGWTLTFTSLLAPPVLQGVYTEGVIRLSWGVV